MSELTRDDVQEIVNTTVSGLAARQQKEFGKMLTPLAEQLTGFNTSLEELRQPKPTPTTTEGVTTAPDPKIAVLERQVNELKSANETAQAKAAKAERDNALSKTLSTYTFSNDVSRDTAFKVFSSEIQVTSDGQYVIGDEPLDNAVKSKMSQLTGLLAPKAVGGSGASGNAQAPGPVNMQIKPGMKAEELEAIGVELAKQLGG